MSMKLMLHAEHGECWMGDHQDPSGHIAAGWRFADADEVEPEPQQLLDSERANHPLASVPGLEFWAEEYAAAGVETAGQLAMLGAHDIDALPIKGIGPARAREHANLVDAYLGGE